MASLDVDTVNIHRFIMGNGTTIPEINARVTFDGVDGTWVGVLLFIVAALWIVISVIHVFEVIREFRRPAAPEGNRPLLKGVI